MSEENKVEGDEADQVETLTDEEAKATWKELQDEAAGQATGTPAATDEDTKADAGQVDKAGTPEGQAAATDTPSEDATKSPASNPDDLWKDATPEQRAAFEAERTRAAAAESVVKVHGGRLTQAYQERDALRAELAKSDKAPPKIKVGDKEESPEEYQARMREEFPDFAPLLDRLDASEARVRDLEGAHTNLASAQTEEALQQQQAILEQAHPTYQDDVTHPDDRAKPPEQRRPHPVFLEWVNKQPGYVQDAIRANGRQITDGQSTADILTRFKAETAPAEQARQLEQERRQEQLDAARGVDTKPAAATGKGEQTPEQIWKELQEENRRAAARN